MSFCVKCPQLRLVYNSRWHQIISSSSKEKNHAVLFFTIGRNNDTRWSLALRGGIFQNKCQWLVGTWWIPYKNGPETTLSPGMALVSRKWYDNVGPPNHTCVAIPPCKHSFLIVSCRQIRHAWNPSPCLVTTSVFFAFLFFEVDIRCPSSHTHFHPSLKIGKKLQWP